MLQQSGAGDKRGSAASALLLTDGDANKLFL